MHAMDRQTAFEQAPCTHGSERLLLVWLHVHQAIRELDYGGAAICATHSSNPAIIHHPHAGQRLICHLHLQTENESKCMQAMAKGQRQQIGALDSGQPCLNRRCGDSPVI